MTTCQVEVCLQVRLNEQMYLDQVQLQIKSLFSYKFVEAQDLNYQALLICNGSKRLFLLEKDTVTWVSADVVSYETFMFNALSITVLTGAPGGV